METAVLVDAIRTPIGRHGGALRYERADDLAALVIRTIVERNHLDGALVDDVVFGNVNGAGEDNRNVARMALLLAGLPVSVSGMTVNRLCASGLEAVNHCAHAIAAGEGDIFIAGGVENMTRAPYVMAKPEVAFGREEMKLVDTAIGWRFNNPKLDALHYPFSMGETAENVAERYHVSREDQDRFAYESQQRTARAQAEGFFAGEIVPVETRTGRKGERVLIEQEDRKSVV